MGIGNPSTQEEVLPVILDLSENIIADEDDQRMYVAELELCL